MPIIIIIRHFISLEPAFWATLPLYSTVDCTVGGSKESRDSTVTLYVYPAAACGGYVGASSSRVAFRAVDVEVSCSVAAGLAGCRAGVGVVLQKSIRDCCVLLVWVLRFGCWSLRFCCWCCGLVACFGWSWDFHLAVHSRTKLLNTSVRIRYVF